MNPLLINLLQSLWILIPGGLANGTPPIVQRIFPKWNTPMDFGMTVYGKRLFGDHKTIRGFIFGIVVAVFGAYGMSYIKLLFFRDLPLIDYSNNTFLYGFASGAGALLGDAFKSMIKRRVGIEPGKSWFPFDQIDWILGILLIYGIFFDINRSLFITILITGLALHMIFRFLGFLFGILRDPI